MYSIYVYIYIYIERERERERQRERWSCAARMPARLRARCCSQSLVADNWDRH